MDGSSFLASFSSDHEIRFNGGTIDSFPVRGEKVTILPSPGDHELGSSKLKITNIVNYGWEHRYHAGQLVAVHKGGVFFAYGVFAPGKSTGVVRVVQRESEERVLLKGMKGMVKDLAFAHCTDSIILGVVDEFANLFVYRIEEHSSDQSLNPELILQIDSDVKSDVDLKHLRLIWCPYLPDEDNEEDGGSNDDSSARLLVLTKNSVADVFNVDTVINEYGNGPLDGSTVVAGRLKILDHRGPITDASFSPDGTAIATASTDGQVKFFQVYMHGNEAPRCLHQWSPHDGKPLSSLFFLDNHLNYNPDEQFWKFAITGANRNTELKVWSCATWTCLQTINFSTSSPSTTELKAALDLSAKYLLLSDIHRKIVYVLRLEDNDSKISAVSVSEFATPSAFLSMAVLEAGVKKIKESERGEADANSGSDSDDDDDDDERRELEIEDATGDSTFIRFLLVQPKSLQECKIIYEDAQQRASSKTFEEAFVAVKEEKISPSKQIDSKQQGLLAYAKQISSENTAAKNNNGLMKITNGGNGDLQKAADKITLMSPEVFEVKPKIKEESRDEQDGLHSTPNAPPPRGLTTLNYLPSRQILAGASGTSSPSREVADILGAGDGDDEIDINVEYVVTEENDDEDEEDEDSDEANIYDEVAIKKEEEEFANLDKILMKQEIKTEDETEDTEDDHEEDPLQTSSARIKQESTLSSSGPALIKQESMLGSPAASSISLIKQEPQSTSSPSTILLKQESESSSYMTPNTNMLSRSFDMTAHEPSYHQMALVMKKLSDMTSLIQTQRAEMQILREEVRALHSNDLKQVENMLKLNSKSQSMQWSEASKRDTKALMSGLSQTVHNSMGNHLEREVKNMTPHVAKLTAENIQHSLTKEVKTRLTNADEALRDAILKMSQSKPAMDAMGQSLAAALQPILQAAFRDMFSGILVPSYERSTQNLFSSVSTTFNKGCKEYENQLKHHVGKQLEPLAKDIRETVAKMSSQQPTFEKSLRDMELRILANVKDLVAQEVRQALVLHSANLSRSLSATPTLASGHLGHPGVSPSVQTYQDLLATVNGHISHGKWNEAFQTALMANNLQLVVATCESVNPMQLFNQNPCPLSQSVLLSLIQQLGHNLEEKTETKHKYLEEAIMNLDTENPATRQHIGNIVMRLQKQLNNFIKTNPDKKITRSMKMLLMATSSLNATVQEK